MGMGPNYNRIEQVRQLQEERRQERQRRAEQLVGVSRPRRTSLRVPPVVLILFILAIIVVLLLYGFRVF